MWERSCPRCRKSIRKNDPAAAATCACGWEWKGSEAPAATGQPKAVRSNNERKRLRKMHKAD